MIKNLKNETDLSGLYFVYNGSVNLERKGLYGISHFLEHIKCKTFDDLLDELQSNGISWNAYTSNNKIVFYFTGLEEYLAPFRDILIERMYLPFQDYTNIEIIENEKKIVMEEYQDSFTNQNEIFDLNLFRNRFGNYSPIGLKEDIENFTYQDCLEFHDIQYKNPDMIINISKTYELVKDLTFEDRLHTLKDEWLEDLNAPLELRGDFPDSLTMCYYRTIDKEDVPLVKLINAMLGSGLNSPLYQEVREKKALCYYIGNNVEQLGNMYILSINILTSQEKSDIVDSTITEILNNSDIYMTSDRLDTIRKAITISIKKKHINRHDNISDILDSNIEKLNSILEDVSLSDIMNIYNKYFILSSFTKADDKNY